MSVRTPAPLRPSAGVSEALLIVNARASGVLDRRRGLEEAVERALATAGVRVERVRTASLEAFGAALRAAAGRRVILLGGDGVLHSAANLLEGANLPELALVPAGRANNIARALDIPSEPAAAARLAATGRAWPLDALAVHLPGRALHAVEGLSAGFQALARSRYRAPNSGAMAAGAWAFARTLASMPRFQARISFDGGPARQMSFAQLFLSTMPYFAFGLRVNPLADPSDGLGEAIKLDCRSRRRALASLLAARDGSHLARRDVGMWRWTRAEILDPLPLAADGEPLGLATARVEVVPGPISLVRGPRR